MEGLKAHYEEQAVIRDSEEKERAIKDAEEKQALKNTLLSRDKEVVLNKALNLIHDDFKGLATAQLESMIDVVYNDKGQPTASFKIGGEVVANNVAEFEGWALEQDAFKRILNGVNSSGANTVQTRASGSTGGDTVQNRLAQRLKNHGL